MGVRLVFDNLHLELNEEKTRVVDARHESFNFLGFSIGMKRGRKTGKIYPHTEPSKKALKHIRSEIKQLTTERLQCNADGNCDSESERSRQRMGRLLSIWQLHESHVVFKILSGVQDADIHAPETPLPQSWVWDISGQVLF